LNDNINFLYKIINLLESTAKELTSNFRLSSVSGAEDGASYLAGAGVDDK